MDAFLLFWLSVIQWLYTIDAYEMPSTGFATMTHYDFPKGAVGACGCTSKAEDYPTAAMSWMAYGSTNGYGPACGRCYRIQLVNTVASDPIWWPANPPSLVLKITDQCPNQGVWCNATSSGPNSVGTDVNFDLAYPSSAIPNDFFPQNVSYYGYTDFGVWNISYTLIPCQNNWAGYKDQSALGSVSNLGPESVCCPADPITYPNTTCPAYDTQNGSTPDTSTSNALYKHPFQLATLVLNVICLTLTFSLVWT